MRNFSSSIIDILYKTHVYEPRYIPKVKRAFLKEMISYFSNTLRFLHRSIKSSGLTSLTTSSHIESSKLAISS